MKHIYLAMACLFLSGCYVERDDYTETKSVGRLISLNNNSNISKSNEISGGMIFPFGYVNSSQKEGQEYIYIFYYEDYNGLVRFNKVNANLVYFKFGDSLDVSTHRDCYTFTEGSKKGQSYYYQNRISKYIITIPKDKISNYISVDIRNF